jgi:P-type Cu+ transporter
MASDTALVLDPVCGMKIDPKKAAAKRDHKGTTFYFCGLGCAKQFDANPEKFAHAGGGHASEGGHAS